MMPRFKNTNWPTPYLADGVSIESSDAHLSVLMDIRDELQTLNRLLGCPNFIDVPNRLTKIGMHTEQARNLLETIRRNTTKKRRRTKKAAV